MPTAIWSALWYKPLIWVMRSSMGIIVFDLAIEIFRSSSSMD